LATTATRLGLEPGHYDPVLVALLDLQAVATRLGRVGLAELVFTLANLAGACLAASPLVALGRNLDLATATQLMLLGLALAGLLTFDRLTRRGEALYQEITEKLEWRSREPGGDVDALTSERIPAWDDYWSMVRRGLREYLSSTHLPLVRSDASAVVYAAANIALALFGIVASRLLQA